MSVRRFFGPTSRDVMRLVRAALGENALILSSRSSAEGVEILAMADETHSQLTNTPNTPPPSAQSPSSGMPPQRPAGMPVPPPSRPMPPPTAAPAQRPVPPPQPQMPPPAQPSQSAYQRAASLAAYNAQQPAAAPPPQPAMPAPSVAAPVAVPAPPPQQPPQQPAAMMNAGADFAALSERLFSELQGMRELINRQASTAAARTDCGSQLHQQLLGAGFGPCLSAEVLSTLPPEFADAPADRIDVRAWLERQIAARLPVLDDEAQLLDSGGVIALVGPTGVGKTTTTAKLAARYVMRHGGQHVALVTTDSFRIGAHEQLRIYARLLGVEVYALAADAPLDELLQQLMNKRLVIIDTVGMSQRDRRLLTQIGQLGAAGRPIRLMLLLNAASHGDTLEEVVDTYQRAAKAAGASLRDCIVSKSDEAARLGPILDILIRRGLRLNYVATGQQVPEDLQLADAPALLKQALAVSQPSPFVPQDSTPANAAQRLEALSRGVLSQGRTLATILESLRQHADGFLLLESIWQLIELPRTLQGERLAQRLQAFEGQSGSHSSQVLWGRNAPGAGWTMPLLTFDADGNLGVRPWLAHQLPAGQDRRLHWAHQCLRANTHLLPGIPDADGLAELAAQRSAWLCLSKAAVRVNYLGERYSLGQLAGIAEKQAATELRYRGRTVRLELQRAGVELRTGNSRQPDAPLWPVQAWFGTLLELDSDQVIGHRHWLAWSPELGQANTLRQMQALRLHIATDDLPSLTLRAWQALGDSHGALQQELRLFMAAGLAATASLLERSTASWAMDTRAQLLNINGGRRPRGAGPLLDALLYLMAARDAFRQIGALGSGLL